MNERKIVRAMAVRIGKAKTPQHTRALNLWADRNSEWLGLTKTRDWASACAALAKTGDSEPEPDLLKVAGVVAKALALDDFDTALLIVLVAVDRLPCASSLAEVCSEHNRNLPAMLGTVAGAKAVDADRAVRRSAVLQLGLVRFRTDRQGILEVDLHNALERVLERAVDDQGSVVAALIGPRQGVHLTLEDFAHIADAGFLVRLLAGANRDRAAGINILIHGPAGTGKTEFARTLAHAADIALYAVGEADADNDEPLRLERVSALQLAQRLLAPNGDAVLLFDEMEDLIGNAMPSRGDWLSEREGSKVFVNRLLETNAVPVIWTTNAVGNVDPAILRRMSYVLKFDFPSPGTARRILMRITAEEGVTASAELQALLHRAPEAATILRGSARAARLAGEIDGTSRPALALVRALRGCELPPVSHAIDLDLFETQPPIAPILEGIAWSDTSDFSMLLSGPPGTGKTALAHHIAEAIGRHLTVVRASDLLSRWVGGTEQAIAEAFTQARERDHALFFDEVDSLLFDRATAMHSWEVTQVNEMLTWLDHYPLPVIAATNASQRLDPAVLRRFAFKIELAPLGRERAIMAFERFFGMAAPAALRDLAHLTPGDFAAVRRQLRHTPTRNSAEIAERLLHECTWRPAPAKLGF